MTSGAQPPKDMVFITDSFMEGLGAGASGAGIASSIEAFTATRAPRTVAERRAGARSATVEVRAVEEKVMAAMVMLRKVGVSGSACCACRSGVREAAETR